MQSSNHSLWVEKYRPQHINEYIFQDKSHRESIERMIRDKTIPHLLFSGVAGTGKTTLAKIIINELQLGELDVLILNASDENSVDIMRDKIKNFVRTYAVGTFKIVLMDEADYLSQSSQSILRNMMEQYSEEARFIFTCNYEHKIIGPLKSRFQHFRFTKGNMNKITEFVANILIKEHVKWSIELVDQYVATGYPDVRKIINLLQQNSNNGVLSSLVSVDTDRDYKFELIDMISTDNWVGARKICCTNVLQDEWEDIYRFLYDNLDKSEKFKDVHRWEEGIIIIAKYLYNHSICADSEINAAAMFIELKYIK